MDRAASADAARALAMHVVTISPSAVFMVRSQTDVTVHTFSLVYLSSAVAPVRTWVPHNCGTFSVGFSGHLSSPQAVRRSSPALA
jgi:hypothetical protein